MKYKKILGKTMMAKRNIIVEMLAILFVGCAGTNHVSNTTNDFTQRNMPIFARFSGVGGIEPLIVISNETSLTAFRKTIPKEEVGMWPKGMKPPKNKDPFLTNAPPDFSKTMLIVLSAKTLSGPEIQAIYETKTNIIIDVHYSAEGEGQWAYWNTYEVVVVPTSTKSVELRPSALKQLHKVEEMLGIQTIQE